MYNTSCDHADYQKQDCSSKQVRVLPAGGDSNIICCRAHFQHEIRFRVFRNTTLCQENKFALPTWEELEIYEMGAE